MEPHKLLDSLEELCYIFIMDLLLFPITIYKLFIDYKNCYSFGYLDVEEGSDKFRERDILPPLRFSVYLSLIIGFLSDRLVLNSMNSLNPLVISENVIQYFFVYAGVSLFISAIITCVEKHKMTGTYFKKIFYAFLYTSSLASMPIMFISIFYSLTEFICKGYLDEDEIIEVLALFYIIIQIVCFWKMIRSALYIFESLYLKRILILILFPTYLFSIIVFIFLLFFKK